MSLRFVCVRMHMRKYVRVDMLVYVRMSMLCVCVNMLLYVCVNILIQSACHFQAYRKQCDCDNFSIPKNEAYII